jgi:hypothetical protein
MKATLSALALIGTLATPPCDPVTVDFATLAGFEYVEGMKLPESVTRFHEQTVKISGFMARECEGTGPVEFFLLINDACGCSGTPMLNEIVYCAMPEGETIEIEPGTVEVTGTMYVGEEKEDGFVVGIYSLDADSVSK